MKRDPQPGDIKVGGALVSDAVRGIIAYTDQIWDDKHSDWLSNLLDGSSTASGLIPGDNITIEPVIDPETGNKKVKISASIDLSDYQKQVISDELADEMELPHGSTVEQALAALNVIVQNPVKWTTDEDIDNMFVKCD